MEPINLEPSYSTSQLPGKCLKCLAEQKLDSCLRLLLVAAGENKELQERYTALLAFLKSPESKIYATKPKNISLRVRKLRSRYTIKRVNLNVSYTWKEKN